MEGLQRRLRRHPAAGAQLGRLGGDQAQLRADGALRPPALPAPVERAAGSRATTSPRPIAASIRCSRRRRWRPRSRIPGGAVQARGRVGAEPRKGRPSDVQVDSDAREWRTREDAARGRRGRLARPRPGEDQPHRDRPQLHRRLYPLRPLPDADAQRGRPRGRRRDRRGRAQGEGLQEGRPGRLLRRARRLLPGAPDRHRRSSSRCPRA